jgi:hypothetical protein
MGKQLSHLWVSLDIIVSEDDIVGGTRRGRDDIEGILRLEALEVDAAIGKRNKVSPPIPITTPILTGEIG